MRCADDAASIYVRNLPFHATEADLEAFFCQAGPVADIRRGANAEGEMQSSVVDSCFLLSHVTVLSHQQRMDLLQSCVSGVADGVQL